MQRTFGVLAAEYLRLVWKTNRVIVEPVDFYDRLDRELPAIIGLWHGQHFLGPFIRRKYHKARVLISRHRDGEINAIASDRLGIEPIRGSGDHGTEFMRKGAVAAFKSMLQSLAEGYTVILTADVPKVSRVGGRGIVTLARESGRPILPLAIASSRRVELDNWDRTAVNLPFGRAAVVLGAPVRVAPDADDEAIEAARMVVETSLNAATARAYEIVDGPGAGDSRA
jgi:hypothetical protein